MIQGLRSRVRKLITMAEGLKPALPVIVAWSAPGGLEFRGKAYTTADAIRRDHPGHDPELICILSVYDASQPAHEGPSEV